MATNDVQVDKSLAAEQRNTELFLPDYLRLSILSICYKILIRDHIDVYHARFVKLLGFENSPPQLKQLYTLLTKVDGGMLPCYDAFEKHIRQEGLNAAEQAVSGNSGDFSVIDHVAFVTALSETIRKAQNLVRDAFSGDPNFMRAVSRASSQFVNWNAACRNDTDAPELVARYVEVLVASPSSSALSDPVMVQQLQDVVGIHFEFSKNILLTSLVDPPVYTS